MTGDIAALLHSAELPASAGPSVESVLREVSRRRRRRQVGTAGLGVGALAVVAVVIAGVPGRPGSLVPGRPGSLAPGRPGSPVPAAVAGAPTLILPASAQAGDTVRLSGTLAATCRLVEIRASATPSSPAFATFETSVQGGQWETIWRVRAPSAPVPVRDSVALLAHCADGSGASVSGLLPLTRTPLRFTVSPTSARVGQRVTLTGSVKTSCNSVELRLARSAASGAAELILDAPVHAGAWSMRFKVPDPQQPGVPMPGQRAEALRVNCIHPISDEQVLELLPVIHGP